MHYTGLCVTLPAEWCFSASSLAGLPYIALRTTASSLPAIARRLPMRFVHCCYMEHLARRPLDDASGARRLHVGTGVLGGAILFYFGDFPGLANLFSSFLSRANCGFMG